MSSKNTVQKLDNLVSKPQAVTRPVLGFGAGWELLIGRNHFFKRIGQLDATEDCLNSAWLAARTSSFSLGPPRKLIRHLRSTAAVGLPRLSALVLLQRLRWKELEAELAQVASMQGWFWMTRLQGAT